MLNHLVVMLVVEAVNGSQHLLTITICRPMYLVLSKDLLTDSSQKQYAIDLNIFHPFV
jgi:hypothetical protein